MISVAWTTNRFVIGLQTPADGIKHCNTGEGAVGPVKWVGLGLGG